MIDARTLLSEMVAIPSVSGDEALLATYLVERMRELGFEAEVDAAGNAVGKRRGPRVGTDQREIVLLGHMDTVPGEIPVRFEGDLLYGRGTVDAKGPLAAFLLAVARATPSPGVTLTVIGAVEEEIHTSKGARFVAPLHEPEACIIGEPSGWDGVTLGYKGSLRLTYRARQPGGHGAGPEPAVAEKACAFWHAVQAHSEVFNRGRKRLFERLLPSLRSIRTDSDGLYDEAHAELGFRLPPGFDTERLQRELRKLDPDADQRFFGHEPAWSSTRGTPLARAFGRTLRKRDVTPRFKHKTGTSDMNVLGPVWSCPIVAYGPGNSLLDHTPNEHVSIAEVERSIDVLAGVLVEGQWSDSPSAPPRNHLSSTAVQKDCA